MNINLIYITKVPSRYKRLHREMQMTPQEIFEYKLRWHKTSSNIVKVHSDLEYEAKQWCKLNLKQHQWDFSKYTAVYEDTFYFETVDMKDNFERFMKQ